MDGIIAKLQLYYTSEIPVANVNQKVFNIIPDRDTAI